ncbi:RHS repeat-associated core domain-containing protein [Promicromonospora sp. NPDC023805]|uniref:RHS repeat domain-containing protein n=1 Tax=Promicromonospora sp. NPDC023805 TaxID=3154696 RepID=UPI0033FF27D7
MTNANGHGRGFGTAGVKARARLVRGSRITAATLVLGLVIPGVLPSMAMALDITDRLSWTIDEAREHADQLGFDTPDVDLVPSKEEDPSAGASDDVASIPQTEPETIDIPAAGTTVLSLLEASTSRSRKQTVPGRAGELGVVLGAVLNEGAAAGQIRVEHLGKGTAAALGAAGPVLALRPDVEPKLGSSGDTVVAPEGGAARLRVDVSHLAGAGGDLVHRLGLQVFPACALTTPDVDRCAVGSPVEDSALDAETMTLSGTIEVPEPTERSQSEPSLSDAGVATNGARAALASSAPAEDLVVGVMAAEAGSTGDWGATSLSSSSSWQVSTQTGAFSWSYPFRTPPAAGGLTPDLSLSYSSASLDGRVASSNNQSSEIGDGWDANLSGFIERKYVSCSEDQDGTGEAAPNNASRDTGDLCWKSDNATMVFNGSSTELIRDGNTNVWRPENDDNTRVEHFDGTDARTPGWNTDDNKEWWKVTTADGTKYWFGRAKRAANDSYDLQSGLVVPVYGNHPGEPCYEATFAASRCQQAWRWMLDYVVDPSYNSMTYAYERYNNVYGYNLDQGVAAYNRAVRLGRIEYGTRHGDLSTAPPARVLISDAERCIATATFDCAESKLNQTNSAYWPDVPVDQICTSSTSCPQVTAPAFFDRKRFTGFTTQVRLGGTYQSVDSWSLGQSFVNPGDGTAKALWLDSITHTGQGGAAADVALPDVTFTGVQLDNRVNTVGDIGPAMIRQRIEKIRTESGALTTIAYSARQCSTSNLPTSPQSNDMRCQPVYWTPEGKTVQVQEYFHHYRVKSVLEDARVPGTAPVETNYVYDLDPAGDSGPAWHYDDNELVPPKNRTWGQLRGYERVDTYVGSTGDPEAPRIRTATRYFRGMHGDRSSPSGGTKSVQIDGINDLDQFAGMPREEITYNGTAVVSSTKSVPWRSVVTATHPDDAGKKAFHTGVEEQVTTVTAPALPGGERSTRVTTRHDTYGMPDLVSDVGDASISGDERCTSTEYMRNLADNILGTVKRTGTVSAACGTTPSLPSDVISDERFGYDGGAIGVAPTRGLLTVRQEVKSYSGTTPSYLAVERFTHDSFGQQLTSQDALGNVTTTAYDTTTNPGLTSKTTVTSPDPDGAGPLTAHVTVTNLDPKWGVPAKVTDPNGKVTSGTYDGLGRLTQVWEPGRVQGTDGPTSKFTYQVRSTGTNAVLTETLNWDASAYVRSSVIYDGLLRQRQAQTPSAAATGEPGRVISESFYDGRGLAVVTRSGWGTTGVASTSLVTSLQAVDSRTQTDFDGAGRPTSEMFQVGDGEKPDDDASYLPKWMTTTSYEGDRTHVNPPTGGVPTTTVSDARGKTKELWQYTGSAPTGTHHVTSYSYDHADRLKGVTDPEKNTWSYQYDIRGRQTSAADPDKGTSSTTYDDAGRVLTTKDARNEILAYVYDNLGRKTSLRDDTTDGPERAGWTYDLLADGTVVKGQPTGSVRLHDQQEYTTSITGYTDRYLPEGQTVSLPDTLGEGVAGEYTTGYVYTADGRLRGTRMPAAGHLGSETVAMMYSATNAQDGMQGGIAGNYVVDADYLPTGELSYLRTGNTFAYQQENTYEKGTRRLDGVTLTQEIDSAEDNLHELTFSKYSYDAAGNVLSVKDVPRQSTGGSKPDQQCFDYDWARRLTEAWTPASGDCAAAKSVGGLGGADPYWKSYSYDLIGNRDSTVLRRSAAQGGDVTSTYTQRASGVASVRPHATTGVTATASSGAALGTASFTYDGAGNMTGRKHVGEPAQKLTWDPEGELAAVAEDTNGDGQVSDAEATDSDEYVYSADGERLVRVQGGVVTAYLPGQEITRTATGEVSGTRYYTFAGKTVAVRNGNLGSHVTSIFADHHGSGTVQITNVTNTVTRRQSDPFGAPRNAAAGIARESAPSSGWVGDRGFLDKTADGTGLTSVGARFYDSLLGSFVSVDPVMDLSDPQQWHAYGYANNNPMTWSDPTGLLLGPLIDGAYTAPTAGKPGSGGWQVGANNTGYTGSWNNGGAGSWARPNTKYEFPVSIRRDSADVAAAEERARERSAALAEQKRAKEYKEQQEQNERKNGWLQNAGNFLVDNKAAISAGLGVVSAVTGIAAVIATATGVGAPVGAVLAGISFATGAVSTAIDCTDGLDASCGVGIASTALGLGGLGAAARATKLGWSATLPSRNTAAADNWQAAGATTDLFASFVGVANLGATGVSSVRRENW